jgi:hypothetical protein
LTLTRLFLLALLTLLFLALLFLTVLLAFLFLALIFLALWLACLTLLFLTWIGHVSLLVLVEHLAMWDATRARKLPGRVKTLGHKLINRIPFSRDL